MCVCEKNTCRDQSKAKWSKKLSKSSLFDEMKIYSTSIPPKRGKWNTENNFGMSKMNGSYVAFSHFGVFRKYDSSFFYNYNLC